MVLVASSDDDISGVVSRLKFTIMMVVRRLLVSNPLMSLMKKLSMTKSPRGAGWTIVIVLEQTNLKVMLCSFNLEESLWWRVTDFKYRTVESNCDSAPMI